VKEQRAADMTHADDVLGSSWIYYVEGMVNW
jgi:hypothetical protein